MKYLSEQYRRFERDPLVWKVGQETAQETFDPEAAQKEFEEKFFAKKGPELANMTPAQVAQEVGAYFEENFSPKQYETEIRAYLRERVQSEDTINSSVVDSVSRYTKVYEAEKTAFYRKMETRISDSEDLMKDAVEKIKDKTKAELGLLNGMIQNIHNTEAATPQIGEVAPIAGKETWAYQIPIVGPIFSAVDLPILTPLIAKREYLEYKEFSAKMKETFLKQFLPALGAQYLNLSLQNLSESETETYKGLSKGFQSGMEDHLEGQLDFILQNSPDAETLKTRLEGLRDETVENYKRNAKNGSFITLAELGDLKRQAGAFVDLASIVNSGKSDDEVARQIEGMDYFSRDTWEKSTGAWANEMVETVRANGTDQAFIETIKAKSGKIGEMTFDQAANTFKDLAAERAKAGVRETLQFAREVNMAANGKHAEILSLASVPDSIHPMVETEREKLINRITIPKNVDDRLLVDFVRQGREGRDQILSDPTQRLALFQAVQNVKARESDPAWASKISSLGSKKTSDLTTNRKPESPTADDETARFLALIVMAKEAEQTIISLDKTKEYEGQNLFETYDGIKAESTPPKLDMRFRDINRLYSTRYVSEASRAGFNGKSIGMGLLTAWLLATAAVNLKKSWKDPTKNPFFMASAAGLYGMKKYHENPEFSHYFSEGAGGQERIVEQTALNSLAKKVGHDRLAAFISDGDEFAALESLMKKDPKEGVAKLKTVREMAHKRNPLAIITKDDLKGVMEDRVQTQLVESEDKTRERTRYLFYETFLSNPKNIRELRDNCQKWLAK
jgi:hypothetical protein